jgi:hypothetical protein
LACSVCEQRAERALAILLRQQADIFGEHREQAAGEETGDEFGVVTDAFERLGDLRQVSGNVARDSRRGARRVKRQRVEPQRSQADADRFVGQIGEPDTMRARVGERRVGGAGAGKVGVEFNHPPDVDDDQEGWPAFLGRQRAGVAFGLATGALHRVVEHLAADAESDLLGFEDVGAALVAINAARRLTAVAMAKSDPPLEDVGVVARVVARRIGRRHTQQLAEVGDEELVIGQFAPVGILPAADEGIERKGCGAGDGIRARWFGHAREYDTETPATAPCPSCTQGNCMNLIQDRAVPRGRYRR